MCKFAICTRVSTAICWQCKMMMTSRSPNGGSSKAPKSSTRTLRAVVTCMPTRGSGQTALPPASSLCPLLVNDPTRCINIYIVLIILPYSSATVGLMDSALAFHPGVPGLIPSSDNDEISSKFPDSLFISKEILNAEISKIGPCDTWTLLSSEHNKALSCSELDKVHSIESVICTASRNETGTIVV